MDSVQLAAYCIAMLAEYLQEQWLAELRDIYQVPSSGMLQAGLSTIDTLALVVFSLALRGFEIALHMPKLTWPAKLVMT